MRASGKITTSLIVGCLLNGCVAFSGQRFPISHVDRKAHLFLRESPVGDDRGAKPLSRRNAFLLGTSVFSSLLLSRPSPASAYEMGREFPQELQVMEGQDALDGRRRMLDRLQETDNVKRQRAKKFVSPQPLGATLWGAALWFLSGSRSNPLVTPVANVLYDETEQDWLKDRNEGLFGDLPVPLALVMVGVFICIGLATDTFITNQLLEGDRNVSLQLAGVSLIAGGSIELGRIFSGEKKQTRQESDRDGLLTSEFANFAEKRLIVTSGSSTGNCHRSDVVRAFRRFYAKYRQADSEEYPLTDLEIEQLLRRWGKRQGDGVGMTSAGFFSGVKINEDADVFVSR